jgi:very-short-patch-repair endonuclease
MPSITQLKGHKFLRQHPIYVRSIIGKCEFYIPDFYCDKMKLVIEADGPVHLYKKEYDKNRDKVLAELGLKIVRFTNQEIEDDIETVLKRISEYLV